MSHYTSLKLKTQKNLFRDSTIYTYNIHIHKLLQAHDGFHLARPLLWVRFGF
jgi:hypothetical protein